MTNIALFCVRSRQGTTSVVLSNSIQVLKGHGFSRAVHAARMFSAAFSSRALRAGGVA